MSEIPALICLAEVNWPAAECFALSERLAVCGRMLRGRLACYLAQRGASEAEFSILWACLEAPPTGLSQCQIAARLAVSPAHISSVVEGLRRKEWLKRRPSAADRRQRVWRLTPSGRSLLEALLLETYQWAAALGERLGKQETANLTRLLDALAEALRSEGAGLRESPAGSVGGSVLHTSPKRKRRNLAGTPSLTLRAGECGRVTRSRPHRRSPNSKRFQPPSADGRDDRPPARQGGRP